MGDVKNSAGRPDDTPSASPQPGGAPRLSTDSLFRGRRELIIEHMGEKYRLRITSKGKLILTK